MKKTIILLAIFCISALNGMEREEPMSSETPSEDLYNYISSLKKLYNDVDTAIEAIKADSPAIPNLTVILNDEVGHQKEFTELVHALGKDFNRQSYVVATKIGTPTAKKYSELCEKLRSTLKKAQSDTVKMQEVTKLLEEGADINGIPALLAVVAGGSVPSAEMIRFLLNSGANPHATNYHGMTALRLFSDMHKSAHDYDKIKLLLQEAMKNWNQ